MVEFLDLSIVQLKKYWTVDEVQKPNNLNMKKRFLS
jgi:hypothetical protein